MGFRLLLDEMTEAALADYCRKLGHDVERVVTAVALGAGTPDHEIVAYAEREHRLVVTYDDDFLAITTRSPGSASCSSRTTERPRSRQQIESTPSRSTSIKQPSLTAAARST